MTTPLSPADRWTTADLPDQTWRTVVVTGGNSGLGFEIGLGLNRRLRAAGIPVAVASVLAHPGFASTNLPSPSGGGVVGFVAYDFT